MLASDDVCKPHTLQVLEIIRKYLGMTLATLMQQQPRRILSVQDLAAKLGRWRLCPKVVLEGIPEWNVLSKCMAVLLAKLEIAGGIDKYQDLKKAAVTMGIPRCAADGSKKTKYALQRALKAKLKTPTGTGITKRTFKELEMDVTAAGGQYLTYKTVAARRVRRRMTRAAMEKFLA